MELQEAHAFAERLRPNIEALSAMPDEALRAQVTSTLLNGPEASAAAISFRQAMTNVLGNYYTQQAVTETSYVGSEDAAVEQQGLGKEVTLERDISDTCEPVEKQIYDLPDDIDSAASTYMDNLAKQYRQIKQNTREQIKGLGQKKAAKIQNREEAQIERLFAIPDPSDPNRYAHIATDPNLFSRVSDLNMQNFRDNTLSKAEHQIQLDLGRRLLKTGEDYVKDHADELRQRDDYLITLLSRCADELLVDPNSMGGAMHLLRGYFASADTPEKAVYRTKAIYEAMLSGYKNPNIAQVASGVLMLHPAYFDHLPYYDNLSSAIVTYHKPELHFEAVHLNLFRSMYLEHNTGITQTSAESAGIRRVETARAEQIKQKQLRIQAEGISSISNYLELAEAYHIDTEEMSRLFAIFSPALGVGNAHDAHEEYLATHPVLGPAFDTWYGQEYPLTTRYQEIYGQARFDIRRDLVQVVNGDLVLEIRSLKEWDKSELEKFYSDFQRGHNADITSIQEDINSLEGINNYKLMAYPVASRMVNNQKQEPTALIRKRTLFDDAHTMPVGDFMHTGGFNTANTLPDQDAIVRHIKQHRTRFVPKRGVEVVITDQHVRNSGLTQLVFRSGGGDRVIVNAKIHGRNRTFQIKDNEFYNEFGKKLPAELANELVVGAKEFQVYCLASLKEWMCRPKIETSEGTIEEGKDGPIKGGYFAYLRVRDEDGRKYRRSDEQWHICTDERGLDLDQESQRLAPLDKSGKLRNSTYVREHPDDGPHLQPLKIYL